MQKFIYLFIVIVCGLILQILLKQYLSIFEFCPEILLLTVIYYGFKYGCLFGEIYGFFAGLFLDIFSVAPFGSNSLCFTIIGYIFGHLHKKLDETNIFVQIILVLIGSYIYLLLMFFIFSLLSIHKFISISNIVIVPFYNIIVSLIVFRILEEIKLTKI